MKYFFSPTPLSHCHNFSCFVKCGFTELPYPFTEYKKYALFFKTSLNKPSFTKLLIYDIANIISKLLSYRK